MSHDDDDPVVIPTGFGAVFGGLSTQVVALVAGVLPFVVHITESRTVNGEIVSFIDYPGVLGGGLALLLGAVALVAALRNRDEKRTRSLVLSTLAILLGAFHVVRGLGLLV